MATHDLVAIVDSVANMLNKHLETISADLVGIVSGVIPGRPDYGVNSLALPIVLVALDRYSEDVNSLGSGAHRDNQMTINLYPITQAGIGTLEGNGQSEAEEEANRLTQNIVEIIRNRPDLSGTVSYVEGLDVDFNQTFGDEGTFVKCSRIGVRCFKYIS